MSGALAVILARAGSRGVPGKNAADVAGAPCIAWTIRAAQAATGVSRVAVSTDGDELARIAREHGCEVVQRPAELAGDTATIDSAARHAVQTLSPSGTANELIVILYANVPVRPAGLIDRALEVARATKCDSVQSYQPVGKHHPWWTARVDEQSGEVKPWEGDILNHGVFRRQDLPPAFVPDGAIIVVRRAALMLEVAGAMPGPHAFFGRERRGVVNPEGSVVDIDSPMDLVVARAVLSGTAGSAPTADMRRQQSEARR